ncbi:hypothetical protein TWF481_002841 [Arthrobotrys musiformis]|uniref:CCHC-type domain-containing protein n=1 Tax=Arthrobotrys musiformis TaxID=47236 RepID=A0AAV9VRI9_9PEZI
MCGETNPTNQVDHIHRGFEAKAQDFKLTMEYAYTAAYTAGKLDSYRAALIQQQATAKKKHEREKSKRVSRPNTTGGSGYSRFRPSNANTTRRYGYGNKFGAAKSRNQYQNQIADIKNKGVDKKNNFPREKRKEFEKRKEEPAKPNCFNCGKPGHRARNCPDKDKRKKGLLHRK